MRKIYSLAVIAAVSLGLTGCNSKPAADNSAEAVVETVAPAENAGAEAVMADNAANAATPMEANASEGEALDGTGTPAGPGK